MKTIVIAGPHGRVGEDQKVEEKASNVTFIETMVKWCDEQYGRGGYSLATVGCDKGFGKDLKEYCVNNPGLQLVEIVAYFHEKKKYKEEYTKTLCARHAALVDMGDVFFISTLQNRPTLLDDLVKRLRSSEKEYMIFDPAHQVVEHRGFPAVTEGQPSEEQPLTEPMYEALENAP